MAFDDRDVIRELQIAEEESVEEIIFRRNRKLSGVQLEILVTKRVGGDKRTGRVPPDKVDKGWPTLEPILLNAIDNAAF